MRTYFVYGLIDPRNMRIFYIGHTYDAQKRLKAHCSCDPAIPSFVLCREIKKAGLRPWICIFQEFKDRDEARLLEREIIYSFPLELVNSQIGSWYPWNKTKEAKGKL